MPRLILIAAILFLIFYGLWTVVKIPLYKFLRKKDLKENKDLESFEQSLEKK